MVNVPWEGSTYINKALEFQNSAMFVGRFNSLDPEGVSSISFEGALQLSLKDNDTSKLVVIDKLAGLTRGTVISGTNNGTTSRYNNGVIDVDIDCGDWA